MKLYEVSYWSEGPGRSHSETVLVLSKDKKSAVRFVIKECGIYEADRESVTVKRFKSRKGRIIQYVRHDNE